MNDFFLSQTFKLTLSQPVFLPNDEFKMIFKILQIIEKQIRLFEGGKIIYFKDLMEQISLKLNRYITHALKRVTWTESAVLKFKNQINSFVHEILVLYVLNNSQSSVSSLCKTTKEQHENNLKFYGQQIFETLVKHYNIFFPSHTKKIKIKYYHYSS